MEDLPRVSALSNDKANELIHAAAGWEYVWRKSPGEKRAHGVWLNKARNRTLSGKEGVARYADSLDAIWGVAKYIPFDQLIQYRQLVRYIVRQRNPLSEELACIDASSRTRVDALLITFKLAIL